MIKRVKPKAGQESVWDYPRPPRVELSQAPIKIVFKGLCIAESSQAKRVLETSHPPVYYLPQNDIKMNVMQILEHQTWCEFKGQAKYWALTAAGHSVRNAAWSYPNPTAGFESIKDHLAFYPSKVDACFVGNEKVKAQDGDFYGGWITSDIVGPFKGATGTWGW